ncbi:hypothetical protein HK101_010033, partial [Irineochytrium annulatum]
MSFLRWIGMGNSGGGKPVSGTDLINSGPGNERYFGMENFGNTCYCNSVLQALYFCKPFREQLQRYSYPQSAAAVLASSTVAASHAGPTPLAG